MLDVGVFRQEVREEVEDALVKGDVPSIVDRFDYVGDVLAGLKHRIVEGKEMPTEHAEAVLAEIADVERALPPLVEAMQNFPESDPDGAAMSQLAMKVPPALKALRAFARMAKD